MTERDKAGGDAGALECHRNSGIGYLVRVWPISGIRMSRRRGAKCRILALLVVPLVPRWVRQKSVAPPRHRKSQSLPSLRQGPSERTPPAEDEPTAEDAEDRSGSPPRSSATSAVDLLPGRRIHLEILGTPDPPDAFLNAEHRKKNARVELSRRQEITDVLSTHLRPIFGRSSVAKSSA